MADHPLIFNCTNSGVVLCHPFLAKLFSTLNYLDSNAIFKNAESRTRAILLLHYVVTGNNHVIKHTDLAFLNILCAVPPNHPIPAEIELSQNEKQEAIQMLQVIINHWQSLKNTSVNALRQTFIQRNGILKQLNNYSELTVESNTVDMLLDTLPWNINIIHLPWLSKPIQVSWK